MNSETELIHLTTKQINIVELVNRLTEIRDRIYDNKAVIVEKFPLLNDKIDCRITGLSKLINVINSSNLGCAFWAKNLLHHQWWIENTSFNDSDETLLRMEFQNFIKLGLFHFSFSAIESTLRCIMRGIDPSAHFGAAVEFKRIYDDLIRNRLTAIRIDFIELLDFFSALRNTIHNNGIYFHKSGNSISRTFKGKSYDFNYGQPIEFASWPLLLEVLSDAANMLIVIVLDTNVISIPGDLIDPAST
ncbi:hypothetical protein FW778_21530 [Ginsengibacter hankyongi]|uniref:Cthe-2314-like HEPN domain-containing protein n=1 Tax=Ginsengibacter hankyongi TaxID=2607284 RepID=A0A5J5IAK1_9BACT|nr:hypothetical protein [Ginsengibacter hankyongi]KAA9035541.1 hypothetical protein FW778_21530 [Ginsengibacter hankyongi]